MAFQQSYTASSQATGNYWVLLSAQITSFPLATAQSQITYGCFVSSAAYQAGADPIATQTFIIPGSLASSIRGSMISTLETFLSGLAGGFFYGATQVS